MLLSAEHLTIDFGSRRLLDDVNFYLNEGDKTGIIGINGTGKSTLLKVLAGVLEPDAGTIARNPNVQVSVLPQNPVMEDSATVLEQVFLHFPAEFRTLNEYEAKSMLNRLGLPDYDQKVGTLSGGQRKRAALAAALIHPADVLVLDEPTNHLDLDTKETLEKGLLEFEGTILFVSHDRYFLNRVATRIVDLQPEGIDIYEGNFDYYQEKRALKDQAAAAAATEKREQKAKTAGYRTKRQRSDEVKRKKRIEELEAQVEALEQEVRQLEELLGQKEIAADYEKVQEIYHDMEEKRALSASLGEEWLALSEGE